MFDQMEFITDDEGLSDHIVSKEITFLKPIWSDKLITEKCNSLVNATNGINVAITKYNGFSLKPKDKFCNCPKCAALNVIKESLAHPGMYGFSHNKIKLPKMFKGEKSKAFWKKKTSSNSLQIVKKRPYTSPLLSDDPILTQIDEKLVTIFEKLDGLEKKIDFNKKWKRKRILFTDRSVQCANKIDQTVSSVNPSNEPKRFRESIGSNKVDLIGSKVFKTFESEAHKESIKTKEESRSNREPARQTNRHSNETSCETKDPNRCTGRKEQSIGEKIFNESLARDSFKESSGSNMFRELSQIEPAGTSSARQSRTYSSEPKKAPERSNVNSLTNDQTKRNYECVDQNVATNVSSNAIGRRKNTHCAKTHGEDDGEKEIKKNASSLIEIKDSIELNRILTLQYQNKRISDDLLKRFARLDLAEINKLLKDYQLKQKFNRVKYTRMNQMLSSKIPVRKKITDDDKRSSSRTNNKITRTVSNSTFDISQQEFKNLRRNDLNAYFVFLDQNENDDRENDVLKNINKLNACNKTLKFLSKKIEYTCT